MRRFCCRSQQDPLIAPVLQPCTVHSCSQHLTVPFTRCQDCSAQQHSTKTALPYAVRQASGLDMQSGRRTSSVCGRTLLHPWQRKFWQHCHLHLTGLEMCCLVPASLAQYVSHVLYVQGAYSMLCQTLVPVNERFVAIIDLGTIYVSRFGLIPCELSVYAG